MASHAAEQAELNDLQTQNSAITAAINARLEAERDVAALDQLQADAAQLRESIDTLLEARRELKARYLLERERASSLRDAVASDLQSKTGERVRIRVHRHGDDLSYRQVLHGGLKGARVRSHEEIVEALLQIRPEELGAIIHENRCVDLEEHTGYSTDRATRILDALRANVDPHEIEVVDIEDRISIELNVGTSRPPNFRDASELSRGQKCTALLPLPLVAAGLPATHRPARGQSRQPIRLRDGRRVDPPTKSTARCFVTHNANIPVLGEAELVVVMGSDGNTVRRKAGRSTSAGER